MSNEIASVENQIISASRSAETLLSKTLSGLSAAKAQASGEPRLFFPNGIELIDIEIKVTNLIDIHLTVSGPKKESAANLAEKLNLPASRVRAFDAQGIIDSCENHWDAYKSDCSGFVKAVATDFGITLTGQADDIVDEMQGDGWDVVVDGPAAEQQAAAGDFVLAGLKGADQNPPQTHGHVVVVVKGPLAKGKYPSAYWGTLNGVGAKGKTINYAWKEADRDNVIYRSKKLS
jgi:hypothetical protein